MSDATIYVIGVAVALLVLSAVAGTIAGLIHYRLLEGQWPWEEK